ncbi:3'-5' DNA helicase [Fusarium oxysporum]|nr:3'-5' DNA helicase [Fusarium oxysporum]
MDSDEFDDDIADEDFITALDQVSSSMNGQGNRKALHAVVSQPSNRPNSAAVAALELEDLPLRCILIPRATVEIECVCSSPSWSSPSNRVQSNKFRKLASDDPFWRLAIKRWPAPFPASSDKSVPRRSSSRRTNTP